MAVFEPSLYQSDPTKFAQNETNTGVVWNKIDKSIPLSGTSSRPLYFSPRLGGAFDVFGTGKTVIRGGWGKYRAYDSVQSNNYTEPVDTAMGAVSWSCGQNDANCYTWEAIDTHATAPPTNLGLGKISAGSEVYVADPTDHEQPLVTSFVVSIDQRLPAKFLLELSYVGNRTQFEQGNPNINTIPLGTLLQPSVTCNITAVSCQNSYRPYQNFAQMPLSTTAGNAAFDSMQLSLLRNVGFLTLQANYTWSKALGVGSQVANGGLTGALPGYGVDYYYGVVPNNREHVLNLAYVFNLPRTKGSNAFVRGVANGWQISGISTFESGANLTSNYGSLTLNMNYSRDNGTAANGSTIYYDNVHTIGTPDVTLQPLVTCNPRTRVSGMKSNQYVNPACFAAAPTNGLGTGGMPYLPGPMFWNSDLSLMKNFKISEHQNLQFRFAGFNFMNHDLTSFSANDSNLYLHFNSAGQLANPNFGIADYKMGHRIMEMGVKYTF
jgi:hypothetical protein